MNTIVINVIIVIIIKKCTNYQQWLELLKIVKLVRSCFLITLIKNISKVSQNLKFFQKSENFPKIWKFSENLKIFQKSENLPKIWQFPKNLKIWIFKEILNLSENLKNFQKSEKFQKKNCQNLSKLSENVSNVLFQPLAGHKFQAVDYLMFQNQKVTHSLSEEWVSGKVTYWAVVELKIAISIRRFLPTFISIKYWINRHIEHPS